jgi:hypothetical protein
MDCQKISARLNIPRVENMNNMVTQTCYNIKKGAVQAPSFIELIFGGIGLLTSNFFPRFSLLNHSLRHHGIGNFYKSANVCTGNVVN